MAAGVSWEVGRAEEGSPAIPGEPFSKQIRAPAVGPA